LLFLDFNSLHLQHYPSRLLEEAVNEFSRLPGVGRKTALRLVLHLLNQPSADVNRFGAAITRLRNEVRYCSNCFNITESETCEICRNPKRDASIIMVVEDIRDVMAIENTGQYNGLYHILGGILSPIDGIGPEQLNIPGLLNRIEAGGVKEVIMALSTTMEGDTTIFYLFRRLKPLSVPVTTIARGIAIGGELEYADEVTLGRSIVNRTPYDNALAR
jgi:recombination protein RecR